jgi:hypothetical protein
VHASCDGLLILSNCCRNGSGYSVCNLATRQHDPLRKPPGFSFLDMYVHRPTGEYRLLLHSSLTNLSPGDEDRLSCSVLALGSDQPPRYIGAIEGIGLRNLINAALVRDSLHWYPVD